MDEPGSDLGERTPSMKLQPENDPGVKLSHSLDSRSAVEVDTDGRAQTVFLRHRAEIGAMGAGMRFRTKFINFLGFVCCLDLSPSPNPNDHLDLEACRDRQYRLASTNRKQTVGFCRRFFCCSNTSMAGLGVSSNQALAMYLHWMFRVNFFFLFTLSCILFFGLVIIFSGFIVLAGSLESDCVRIGGEKFGVAGTPFADAFALSWTTFSTVGYGSTYPALGNENESPTNCLLITAICSLESFIGVLYSGFCGAILFGKILRIQSHAQVIFSDPIVIRYGNGIDLNYERGDDTSDDEGRQDSGDDKKLTTTKKKKKISCPVLEFRIVNRLFNEVGGEIMDAALNVVANVDANEIDPIVGDRITVDAPDSSEGGGLQHRRKSESVSSSSSTSENKSEDNLRTSIPRALRKYIDFSIISGRHRRSGFDGKVIEEDPTSKLVSKHIFSKMVIEAGDHPFFKRVWLARHVLDDSSPLLTPRARRAIMKNGGYWPEHLNSYAGVRQSLKFNQILVSLNGVSNVSASDVYAQKIYDFVDVNVGYQFVNLLYRGEADQLQVDVDLINDVREQTGGGGEPLTMGD